MVARHLHERCPSSPCVLPHAAGERERGELTVRSVQVSLSRSWHLHRHAKIEGKRTHLAAAFAGAQVRTRWQILADKVSAIVPERLRCARAGRTLLVSRSAPAVHARRPLAQIRQSQSIGHEPERSAGLDLRATCLGTFGALEDVGLGKFEAISTISHPVCPVRPPTHASTSSLCSTRTTPTSSLMLQPLHDPRYDPIARSSTPSCRSGALHGCFRCRKSHVDA